jgi:hypothetical protein
MALITRGLTILLVLFVVASVVIYERSHVDVNGIGHLALANVALYLCGLRTARQPILATGDMR